MSSYFVNEGQVSSGLVINYGDVLTVAGGTATETMMNDGSAYIESGLIESTTMNYASMTVSGGTVFNTVMSGGSIYATYGSIEDTTVNSGARLRINNWASATNTVVNFSGYVEAHAKLNDTIVNSYGSVGVYGNTATNVYVNTGGRFTATNSATVVNNLVVSASGWNYTNAKAENSATINGATVIGMSATLIASGGAKVNDVELLDGGYLDLYGGTATNVAINEGGSMSMNGSSVATEVSVNQGGWFSAGFNWYGYYGDLASIGAKVVENGGAVYIGSGNVSNYIPGSGTIYSSGVLYPVEILSNTFSGLTYSTGRYGTVHSGTTAVDITAINGGLIVCDGGIANGYTVVPYTFVSSFTSTVWNSSYNEETQDWDYTSSSFPASETVTWLGGLTVLSGGTVTGLVAQSINSAYDDPYTNTTYLNFEIASGTVISGTVDGAAFETENGALSDVSVKDVMLTYLEGATVSNISQYHGGATVMSGAYASNLNFSGGSAVFSSGAVVDVVNTFALPYTYVEYGMSDEEGESEEFIIETSSGANVSFFAGATLTNLNMDSWSHLHMQVAPDTILNGTSGGVAIDLKDAHFDNATLGNTVVEVLGTTTGMDWNDNEVTIAGGTVSDLIILNGATVTVMEGGEAWGMVENGGALHLSDDWMEEPLGLYSITSNTFSSDHLEGQVTVHKNTVALDNIMCGGELAVFSGGVVSNFYNVAGAGKMNMYSFMLYEGAIVTNLDTVRYAQLPYHPGNLEIYGGVYLADARLTDYDGITLTVTTGSVFTNCSMDDVPFSIEDGVLSGFMANGEGWFSDYITIENGAYIIDSYIDAWGQVELMDGACGNHNTFARNYIYVNSGAVLEKTTLGLPPEPEPEEPDPDYYPQDKSATMYILNGGVVRDVTVNQDSNIEVNSGGKLTGRMELHGRVNAWDGIVDFDITTPDAGSVARVNNLGWIQSSPTYTITVDGVNQASGTYMLAEETLFEEYTETTFYLVDVLGSTYGYFIGTAGYALVFDEELQAETYVDTFDIQYYSLSPVQPGFAFTLNSDRSVDEESVIHRNLYLTVESEIAPTAWFAAPTVTADIATFTNEDVFLTVAFDEETTLREYSTDYTVWQAFEGDGITVSENNTYFFRGYNADGTESEITGFQVSNIDKVAPTVATDLAAAVDGSTVTLSWTDATDDYSHVRGFYVSYWQDGMLGVLTETVPGTNLVLDEMISGTWNWTVTAFDYAGNASEAVAGGQFVVTDGYIPRLDLPDFLTGNFNGGSADQMVTVTYADNIGSFATIYVDGTPWGNGLAVDPSWMISGIGDFNADGQDDFLRVNGDGYVVGEMTQPDGSFVAQVLNFKNAGWDILGTGDFNGNGSDDILIANPTGASDTVGLLGYWESGVTWTLINGYSAEWECIATGDYNADGKCDMLWRNSFTGEGGNVYNAYCTWIVDDPVDWRMVSVANPLEWDFLCSGDFNADGCNEWSILSAVNTDEWKLVGVGDFNGDGTDDIAWCSNISGLAGYWQINDKQLTTWSNLANLA